MIRAKQIAIDALLVTIALALYGIEMQIPVPVPIPGAKLGLANIITVIAIFRLQAKDAAMIFFVRVLLGSIFSGNMMGLLYSFVGGLFCFLLMILLRKIMKENQLFLCSAFGAIAHNCGQIFVAILVTKTVSLLYYLPFLIVVGVISGLFTGVVAQLAIKRIKFGEIR